MSHVFVSYVREDSAIVDEICTAMEGRGIHVWLDREKIEPGTNWREAIRNAIKEGAHFLACFSDSFTKRTRTQMYEELTIAIDELRLRPRDRAWFIPVLLTDCEIPDLEISASESLRDIQWVEYYRNPCAAVEAIDTVVRGAAIDPTLDSILRELTRHLDTGSFNVIDELLAARDVEISRFGKSREFEFFIAALDAIRGKPRARKLFNRISQSTSDDIGVYAMLEAARQSFALGDFRHTISSVRAIEAARPTRGATLLEGLCHLGLGDRDKAYDNLIRSSRMDWVSDRDCTYWSIPHAVLQTAVGDCAAGESAFDECTRWRQEKHIEFQYPFVGCTIVIDRRIRSMVVAGSFDSIHSGLSDESNRNLRGYKLFVGRCVQILRRDTYAATNWKQWASTNGWPYPENLAHFRTRMKASEKELFQRIT